VSDLRSGPRSPAASEKGTARALDVRANAPRPGRRSRPRFVAALCLAALVAVALEFVAIVLLPFDALTVPVLDAVLTGPVAVLALMVHAAFQSTIAVGLWRLRRWARMLAMGYLGFLLASFLLWGLGGVGAREAVSVLVFQVCGLPFLTFSFMYLYGGGRYFS
jgi:hypothetical protein